MVPIATAAEVAHFRRRVPESGGLTSSAPALHEVQAEKIGESFVGCRFGDPVNEP